MDLSQKWSSVILEELMDVAGGDRWSRYKRERAAAGGGPPSVEVLAPKSSPPRNPVNTAGQTGVSAALP